MQLQLADIVDQLHRATVRLDALVAATPIERWNARPEPTAWSPAECIAHLNLTSRAYVPLLERALAEAAASGVPAPAHYRRTVYGWMISATTGPLPKIGRLRLGRVKTMPAFVPTADEPREALVAEFKRLQDTQLSIVHRANGLPLHAVRVQSAFVEKVTYDAYSAMLILPRHQHRHLQQAELAAAR